MTEIRVPKLNANDATYVLLDWLAKDGDPVAAGAPLAEVETSKAVEEIAAPAGGLLRRCAPAGAEVAPGQLIATLAGETPAPAADTAAADAPAEPLVTAPARARMAALGVTDEQVARLGVRVVRAADVEALAAPAAAPPYELSKVQRAVGRAVSRSHATIPAAYTVAKIDVGAALDRAKAFIRQVRQPVGLANLVIEAVAGLHARFPLCYGELSDDGATVRLAAAPHIGVTVDVGTGLYVPVIRDADALAPGDLARRLAEIRERAVAGTFRAADLDGANIVVTLHTEADVLLAVPFVYPGQACALAVAAPQPELVLGPGGEVVQRQVAHIGLAYDHRVVNGRDAARYLDALRAALR